ncbi:MAG TPA: iron-containing redox enzyme family protein [Tepidiformaceae bacterium]|nr:iron-containing redox enzyme family protein [Tepidiformaceae bacterium]
MGTTEAGATLEQRLKAVTARKGLLGHPFFMDWVAGTLPPARVREFARQYYAFEAAFPRYLSAIHTRTESPAIRGQLLENLWDEEHGERNHPVLWLEFAEALGLSRAEVQTATLRPETRALLEHYWKAAREAPIAEALGALFAFEGQVPAISWQTIKGLTERYGFEPRQFEFFSVHLVADIAHAGAEMEAIKEACTDEDAVVAAVEAACDRLLAFLDGCHAEAEG